MGSLPEGLPSKIMVLRWFARTYRWPPEVVDRLPVECLQWFPIIEQAESEAQEMKQKEEQRAAQRETRRR